MVRVPCPRYLNPVVSVVIVVCCRVSPYNDMGPAPGKRRVAERERERERAVSSQIIPPGQHDLRHSWLSADHVKAKVYF